MALGMLLGRGCGGGCPHRADIPREQWVSLSGAEHRDKGPGSL